MANWIYNASDYTARKFELIPEGDHRVRIKNVIEKTFSTGSEGFEITLDVPGYNSKLWYYLILDPTEPAKTNQRIGMFFDSFAIQDHDFSHFNRWVGKDGAVRVKHNMYNGSKIANVAFCLSRSQQSKFTTTQANPVEVKKTATIPTTHRNFNGFSMETF